MSIFRSKLSPAWRFKTEAERDVIWKLLVSPGGIIVGEERNIESKRGSIFAIDIRSGNVLWRGLNLGEPWWFNIEKATEDTLFVQTFRTQNLPEPQGIIAIDLQSGEVRWHDRESSLLFIANDNVYATRQHVTGREYLALNADDGSVRESYGNDSSTIDLIRAGMIEDDPYSQFAEHVRSGEPFQSACRLVEQVADPNELRGSVESLECGNYRVLAFHVRGTGAQAQLENVLRNELAVFDRGKLVFQETLARESPFPVPDNFFLSHDHLLYVKDKQVLTAVALA